MPWLRGSNTTWGVKKAPASSNLHAETGLSLADRILLYATAAITGAIIMVGQILGAKMLSPFFGLSHFVWTAQIVITLMALSAGYYLGGRVADRMPKLGMLYGCLFSAAVWLALTVPLCEPVAFWCLGEEDSNLALGSLLAAGILFFVPLVLLAVTVPFLVRLVTSSVHGVGANVGRLSFLSTAGSFAGTLAIGYWMVPRLPNYVSMQVIALVLTALCAVYFLKQRQFGLVVLPAALILVLGFAIQSKIGAEQQFRLVTELFRGNSHFGQLQVVENQEGTRYFLNDNLIQNTYDPKTRQSESAFTYMLSGLARAYVTNITDVLCIGLGVGIVPMDFARAGVRVDVAEINPAVVPVATRFFDFDPAKVNVTIDDGRHFLNRCQKQYDVVVLDAFLGDSSPTHLMTREAFDSMRRRLRPGGALVINAFAEVTPGKDFFAASMSRTLQSVFGGVRLHTRGSGAIFYVATPRANPEFAHVPDLTAVHQNVRAEVDTIYGRLVDSNPDSGRVLTDNYNPAEYYDARNRETIRRYLARGARHM